MSSEETKKKIVEFVGAPPAAPANFYSNQAQIRVSNADVQIMFGQIIDTAEEKTTAQVVGMVYLSHEHAQRIAEIILKSLEEMKSKKTAATSSVKQ